MASSTLASAPAEPVAAPARGGHVSLAPIKNPVSGNGKKGAGTHGLVDGRTAMDVTVTQGTNRVKAHLAGGPGALSIVPTDVRLKEPKDLKKALDRLLR